MQETVQEQAVDAQLALDLYRQMVQLREFELKVQELYRAGKLPGFVHLYVGEEAIAAGICAQLRETDIVYSTHRGHGHALAKGVSGREVMAELWGKVTGSSGGRGGSMHMYAPSHGFMGTNGIVGAGIPLATGAALSSQLQGQGRVSICFFGDGAVNSGSFHEAVNLGAVWNLPVIYVCENNLYATEMAFSRATRNTSVASRAQAYDLPGVEVDGNNVLAVYAAAETAIQRARMGEGPTLIECKTYRIVGHHEGDPGTDYRTREEVAEWRSRDPIKMLKERCLSLQLASAKDLQRIESEVAAWLEDSVQFAQSSAEPEAGSVLEHLW